MGETQATKHRRDSETSFPALRWTVDIDARRLRALRWTVDINARRLRALRWTVPAVLWIGMAACAPEAGTAADRPRATEGSGDEERIARVESDLRPAVPGREGEGPFTIQERMRQYDVPGISIAVVDRGRIAWARGYGVAEAGTERRVTDETLFQAASISKPIAALVALRLVEEGRLSLDEDVNRHLSGWRVPAGPAARGHPVTLRGLMTHTAGLSVHGFPGYPAGARVPTLRQVLGGEPPAVTGPVRVVVEPGTEARYSGGGYTVLEYLVERATGRPFPRLAAELVLEPLGAAGATFEQPLPEPLHPRAASGHDAAGRPLPGRWHTYPERAAAGLWASASDLARYILELQRAAAGEGEVLQRSTARSVLRRQVGEHGLGPVVAGRGEALRFEHGGYNAGFLSFLQGFVHGGRGVVVMTNGERGMPLIQEVVGAVAREYGWPAAAAPPGQMVPASE